MDFDRFKEAVQLSYNNTRGIETGEVANYIPQLSKMNPDLYGVSVCGIDGEILEIGDTHPRFCLQSCSKPLNYCIARQMYGHDKVHSHVGYEPSGQTFNAHVLNKKGLPHNPMINAGAIMVTSLIERGEEPAHRFGTLKDYYSKMAGNIDEIGIDEEVFLSEQHHANRNLSLAYYMRENDAFGSITPGQVSETLDLYFRCCSMTINARMGSVIAGTLAKGGICPVTGEQVFSTDTVRDCLCLMFGCGMYDFSGQFAFKIGLPAKSGVSGCLLLVIPGIAGICVWSPRLDDMGNTVRGVEFCKQLIRNSPSRLHMFQNMFNSSCKSFDASNMDPDALVQILITAASTGNLERLKQMEGKIDYNTTDYDQRSALHLAAAEGHIEVVRYILSSNVDSTIKDRWGNTPYHEAHQKVQAKGDEYDTICSILTEHAEKSGQNISPKRHRMS